MNFREDKGRTEDCWVHLVRLLFHPFNLFPFATSIDYAHDTEHVFQKIRVVIVVSS